MGWHKPGGALWTPTDHVTVLSKSLFPSAAGAVQLGIQGVVYAQDSENGTTTTLHLRLPQALSTLPNPFGGPTEFSGPTAGGSPGGAKVEQPDTSRGQPASSTA